MIEEIAIETFQKALDRDGPDISDIERISSVLDALHRVEFVSQHGISARIATHHRFEAFLDQYPRVFRTPETMQGFAFAKPHGYAGDFEIIERIYDRVTSSVPGLSKWDDFFHSGTAPQAVRNRGAMLENIIARFKPKSLLSVGSGPGIDVLRATMHSACPEKIDLLDNDAGAIARSTQNLTGLAKNSNVRFFHKNALRFRSDTNYDVIWSSGLFDYLNDKTAQFLIKRLYSMLSDNGVLAIGNFSTENRSRAYMEIIGQWFLIHRDRSDLLRIANDCGLGTGTISIIADDTGLNLFLILSKNTEI